MGELKFNKITLEDKKIFNRYFSEYQIEISEYTFTNLFVWRNSRSIEYAEFKGGFLILADYGKEKYFMPPLGYEDYKDIICFILDYGILNNIADSVKRICETRISSLNESGLKITEDRDNFDYVYSSGDLAHLKGRKYSGKRNIITNFLNDYNFEYKKYENKYLDECLRLSEDWVKKKSHEDKSVHDEFLAIKELLLNSENLDATGGVLLIDGKVEAFAFGEKLNDSTYVIHFEKANPDFKGIYQVINKLFIENEILGKYDYVNREQDLGIPGIRKAKESYFPYHMVKKYIVSGK
jgi:uncharacterized protein